MLNEDEVDDAAAEDEKQGEEETDIYNKNQSYLRSRYGANKRLCLSKGVMVSNGKRIPQHSLGAIVEELIGDGQEQKYKITLAKPWAEFPVSISKERVQNLFSFGTFLCLFSEI